MKALAVALIVIMAMSGCLSSPDNTYSRPGNIPDEVTLKGARVISETNSVVIIRLAEDLDLPYYVDEACFIIPKEQIPILHVLKKCLVTPVANLQSGDDIVMVVHDLGAAS